MEGKHEELKKILNFVLLLIVWKKLWENVAITSVIILH